MTRVDGFRRWSEFELFILHGLWNIRNNKKRLRNPETYSYKLISINTNINEHNNRLTITNIHIHTQTDRHTTHTERQSHTQTNIETLKLSGIDRKRLRN